MCDQMSDMMIRHEQFPLLSAVSLADGVDHGKANVLKRCSFRSN